MPSPTEEFREQISLPSSLQMELLFKIKNKKTQLSNRESQSLNFQVACSFNRSSTQEPGYHTVIHLSSLVRGAEDESETQQSPFPHRLLMQTNDFNLSGFWFLTDIIKKAIAYFKKLP